MINRLLLSIFLFAASLPSLYAGELLINKILYKNNILTYNEPVVINVFFKQINPKDIIIYFNNKQVTDIKTNLNSYNNENTFFPTVNFKVNNLQPVSNLLVYVILDNGVTIKEEKILYFQKGLIVDDANLQVTNNKVFYVRAGLLSDSSKSYEYYTEGQQIIKKIDEVICDNVLYYKFQTVGSGDANLNLYEFNKSTNIREPAPFKTIKVNVND